MFETSSSSDGNSRDPYEKGFNPTLFDSIKDALNSYLGQNATKTLFYAIQERFNLLEAHFPLKPLKVLQHLKEIIGEEGFKPLERLLVGHIKRTFQVTEKVVDVRQAVDLAKRNYLKSSL